MSKDSKIADQIGLNEKQGFHKEHPIKQEDYSGPPLPDHTKAEKEPRSDRGELSAHGFHIEDLEKNHFNPPKSWDAGESVTPGAVMRSHIYGETAKRKIDKAASDYWKNRKSGSSKGRATIFGTEASSVAERYVLGRQAGMSEKGARKMAGKTPAKACSSCNLMRSNTGACGC